MPSAIVIGAQWGDEGKGKVVDALAQRAEVVVRFQGGNNAGHTLVVDGHKTILHLIPSGILRPEAVNVIGQGCVIDVDVVLGEIAALVDKGVLPASDGGASRLRISRDAAVIMPYHIALDHQREARLASKTGGKLGTTGRGIGPTYEDVAARRAVRIGDLLDRELLEMRLARVLDEKNAILTWAGGEPFEVEPLVAKMLALGQRIAPYVTDAGRLVRGALAAQKHVLFEGAQGALLDVLHGTFPYVTSSQTLLGGASHGAGVAPRQLERGVGVVKAYQTRVGTGPFPTELHDAAGDRLREVGQEFGSTTGRPRRCGWLDLPALRYSARLNGFSVLALMKLDVLSGMPELEVCTAYQVGDELTDELPTGPDLAGARPVYERLEGWAEDITKVREFDDLPLAAQAYVRFIEAQVEVPIALIGVGPGRADEIRCHELWASD